MDLLVNIDVPNLAEAIAFYVRAFDLVVTRRLGDGAAELSGLPVRLYLLEKPDGSISRREGRKPDPRPRVGQDRYFGRPVRQRLLPAPVPRSRLRRDRRSGDAVMNGNSALTTFSP
jgi:catechol 2,3-dioxygenase-like lactoylglutathione lyase family enzyme